MSEPAERFRVQTASAFKSMTGFAQARAAGAGWSLRVSIRTVNHRFLDLHLRLPEGLESLEPRIRQEARGSIRRGHVDVFVHVDPAAPSAVQVNREVAAAYMEAAEALREQFGLKAEPDVAGIFRLPGVIAAPAISLEDNAERFADLVVECLRDALARLDHMRASEGRSLAEELAARLENISSLAGRIEILAEKLRPAYAARLESRLRELLGETPVDQARIAQEAAMIAERTDTAEELGRLRSHVQQFGQLLSGAEEAGKKMEFLLQEMQREANTLLSKTRGNDPEGIEITRLGLEMKSEIERVREQVQNIE